MRIQKDQTVTIGEAAKLCGVTVKQIRHWQSRGYIPEPQRIVCGERAYRQFRQEELEIIKTIKSYLDDGFQLSRAAQKAITELPKNGIIKQEEE
jgi:DNA-binding transcriptional MerR regulator